MALIEIEAAAVQIGRTPILSEVNLTVSPGDVVWLRGPNGAGKSTLLRVMAGLLKPTSGSIRLFGQPLSAESRRRIGLVAHLPALYEDLSLEENLQFVASLIPAGPHRTTEALRAVGLAGAAKRKASQSSEGMRRRTDLARLLLTDYDLLLLDEAQSGLDADAAGLVQAIIEQCQRRGGACVFVSHSDAVTFATREATISEGRIK